MFLSGRRIVMPLEMKRALDAGGSIAGWAVHTSGQKGQGASVDDDDVDVAGNTSVGVGTPQDGSGQAASLGDGGAEDAATGAGASHDGGGQAGVGHDAAGDAAMDVDTPQDDADVAVLDQTHCVRSLHFTTRQFGRARKLSEGT